MIARSLLVSACVAAGQAWAQDGGVTPVLIGPGDFPAREPIEAHARFVAGPEGAFRHGARVSRIHQGPPMTVWREARGAAQQAFGTVELWLGSLTQSKALMENGNEHVLRGSLWRSGPATREVARRRAIVLKRTATIKMMRAREARSS
jgi:hypothetical protein